MLWLKFICAVVAIFATGLFVNNLYVDMNESLMSRSALVSGSKENNSNIYVVFRLVVLLVMAIAWGGVILL